MTDLDFLTAPEKLSNLNIIDYQYFNQLLNNRTVVFNKEVDEDIIEAVYLPLKNFEEDDSDKPVTLILNSDGGSVADGFFLAYYLASYKKKLNIIVTGYACSMATVLLAAGGKNENVTRKAFPCSFFLLHSGYVAITSSETVTAGELLRQNEKMNDEIRDFIVNNTNVTEDMYEQNSRKQWFLSAEEAKELNFIDEIME